MLKLPIKEVRKLVEETIDAWSQVPNADENDLKSAMVDLYCDVMVGVISKPAIKKEKVIIPWKEDFKIYEAKAIGAKYDLLNNPKYMRGIADILGPKFHPEYSLMKCFSVYWEKKEWWINKKGKKGKNPELIDWKATLRKTVKFNTVTLYDAILIDQNKKNDSNSEPELAL